jgi:hypothetical protein
MGNVVGNRELGMGNRVSLILGSDEIHSAGYRVAARAFSPAFGIFGEV